ncbi:MAG TPA: flagellin [Planctomycetota bacterium]|nr:flagellin [Planctomycetota bacterium]
MNLPSTSATFSLLRAMQQTQSRLDRTFTHLATGKRIASASDDAAGLAISQRLLAQERGYAQGERNLQDGGGYTATTEGSLQSSNETLQRMRELAVQAGNGTLSETDRATIQEEYDQLAATLDQTSTGSLSTTFTDGNGGEITVDVTDTSAAALGVGGLAVGDPGTLEALDHATDQVSAQRGRLGAAENQLGRRSDVVAQMREAMAAARSRIEDADYATEMASLMRDRILHGMQAAGLRLILRAERTPLNLLA